MTLLTVHAQRWDAVSGWAPAWMDEIASMWEKIMHPPAGLPMMGRKRDARIWTDNIDPGYIADGREGGKRFVRDMLPRWMATPATCWEPACEPPCNGNDDLARLREYTLGAIEQANIAGVKLCILNLPEGNPHDNGTGDVAVSAWKLEQLRPAVAAAAASGHYVGLHAYWRPGSEGPSGRWHALGRVEWTLQQWNVPGLQVLVTETGIDGGIAGGPAGQGWRSLSNAEMYRADLVEAERFGRTIPGLQALMVYGFGPELEWRDFEIDVGFARSLVAPIKALGEETMPEIPKVVWPIQNVSKPWYSADQVWGPYDEHPTRAADLNLESGGDSDLGEPVVAPFAGFVVDAADYGRPWGGIVQVLSFESLDKSHDLNLFHARHLDTVTVKPGDIVRPGQVVGTIGTGGGAYGAHLHTEMCVILIPLPKADWRDRNWQFVAPARWYQQHGIAPAEVARLTAYDHH